MSTAEGEQSQVPEQLVDQLVKGYDALSVEIKLLDKQRHELENKLSWAKQQYLDALKRFSPQTSTQDYHTFLDELEEAGAVEAEKSDDWMQLAQRSSDAERQKGIFHIQRAADAREKINYRRRASDNYGVRIWNGKSADKPDTNGAIEEDFTTYNGTPGRLKCPFVAPKKRSSLVNAQLVNGMNGRRTPRGSSISRGSHSGRRSKRSSFHDPIRAEMCGFDPTEADSPSIEGSAPLCPIRFLDQHSPEEVATYFEKHKHELPRSHEICVKRYQSNEESIKELDDKYGNLVSMIQGLGQVHQPMLPDVPDEAVEDEDAEEVNSKDRVQKWASVVNANLSGAEIEDTEATANEDEEEERQAHFDRPLKDVRVGESPSRPWGITVPDVHDIEAKSDHTAEPGESGIPSKPIKVEPETPAKGKCPFDHTKFMMNGMPPKMPHPATPPKSEEKAPLPATTPRPTAQTRDEKPPPIPPAAFAPPPPPPAAPKAAAAAAAAAQPQLVFNGPVFFGYTPEQAMAFLGQAGGNGFGKG